jgi:hypothetical protein
MSATTQAVPSHYQAAAEQPADRLGDRAGDDLLQFVICLIGNEEFAVDVLSVQEINRIVEVTRVPKTPSLCGRGHQSAGPHHSRTGPPKTIWPERRPNRPPKPNRGGLGAGTTGRVDCGFGGRSPAGAEKRH